MRHVGLHQMPGCQRRTQGKLTGQYTGGDYARKLLRVAARRGWVWTADAEEVEHGGLRFEDGSAADGANFYAGHRDGDLEGAVEAEKKVSIGIH